MQSNVYCICLCISSCPAAKIFTEMFWLQLQTLQPWNYVFVPACIHTLQQIPPPIHCWSYHSTQTQIPTEHSKIVRRWITFIFVLTAEVISSLKTMKYFTQIRVSKFVSLFWFQQFFVALCSLVYKNKHTSCMSTWIFGLCIYFILFVTNK